VMYLQSCFNGLSVPSGFWDPAWSVLGAEGLLAGWDAVIEYLFLGYRMIYAAKVAAFCTLRPEL